MAYDRRHVIQIVPLSVFQLWKFSRTKSSRFRDKQRIRENYITQKLPRIRYVASYTQPIRRRWYVATHAGQSIAHWTLCKLAGTAR